MNSEASKAVIRTKFLEKRLALSEATHENQSFAIANHCLKLPIWDLEYFHLFLPIKAKAEIDTSLILTLLQGRDKQVIVPKIKGRELTHILLTDSTKLRTNAWGIPEPEQGISVTPQQIDVVFIPLLGYDNHGNRVGYGKGFYDTFLSMCKPEILKVGLSFFKAVDKIEGIRPEDVPLDYCVNPEGITVFSKR